MAADLFLPAIFDIFAEFYDPYTHLCNLYVYLSFTHDFREIIDAGVVYSVFV